MSRGFGPTQWAVYERLHGLSTDTPAGPQEISRLAVGVWLNKRYDAPPDPLPRSWLVTVRRAVAAMEAKGTVVTGYAPRRDGARNFAHARLGLDLSQWAWMPGMEPPAGWCCLLSDAPNLSVASTSRATRRKPVRRGRNVSVASPGQRKPWGIQSEEEAHALYADMVDAVYKVEPMASELRAMTSMNAIVDRICEFFDLAPDGPQRPYVLIQVLRHFAPAVDNIVDNTMDIHG